MKYLLFGVVFWVGQTPEIGAIQYNSEQECIAGAEEKSRSLADLVRNGNSFTHWKVFCTSQLERVCVNDAKCEAAIDKEGSTVLLEVLVGARGEGVFSFKQFNTLDECFDVAKERNASLSRPTVANEYALGSHNGKVTVRGISAMFQTCKSFVRTTCEESACTSEEDLQR